MGHKQHYNAWRKAGSAVMRGVERYGLAMSPMAYAAAHMPPDAELFEPAPEPAPVPHLDSAQWQTALAPLHRCCGACPPDHKTSPDAAMDAATEARVTRLDDFPYTAPL